MTDPELQLALVRKAFASGLSNCYDWLSDKITLRVANDPDNLGLTPRAIKEYARDHVVKKNGVIVQKRETRANWTARRDFWYYVVVPIDGFPGGLFVEMELTDDDPDCPVVSLVNAHPEQRP